MCVDRPRRPHGIHEAAAIASRAGDARLYVTRKPGMSSLLEPDPSVVGRFSHAGRFQVVESTHVPTLPLDSAASTHDFEDACFLKIDTQGTELDILRSGERLLPSVLGVEVEVSFSAFYRGQALFADVDAFLRERGFKLFLLHRTNMRHAHTRRDLFSRRVTVYGHALYFRDSATLDPAGRRVCSDCCWHSAISTSRSRLPALISWRKWNGSPWSRHVRR
jgi:FkbM family methyltransferase